CNVIIRRQLKRRYVLPFFQKLPPCLIGIEACASSHHWSRELKALGHTVRLMPAAYVKPYVKRQKNDAADAEAICEALTRANIRFVATKTLEQQSCLIGPALATALVASVADPKAFRSERNFSAWIGLVPKQHSSGARTSSAVSANKEIAICAACSPLARWPLSAMPRSMAPNVGPGLRHCWRGGRPTLRRSRSPTRSQEWRGP